MVGTAWAGGGVPCCTGCRKGCRAGSYLGHCKADIGQSSTRTGRGVHGTMKCNTNVNISSAVLSFFFLLKALQTFKKALHLDPQNKEVKLFLFLNTTPLKVYTMSIFVFYIRLEKKTWSGHKSLWSRKKLWKNNQKQKRMAQRETGNENKDQPTQWYPRGII